ncbi:toxin [Candidatus Williamhamiltonella defendens]|nr:toxin [Candidatus Hamiltonella defensa]
MIAGNLDVLTIQEAGALPDEVRPSLGNAIPYDQTQPPLQDLPECYIGNVPDGNFDSSSNYQSIPGPALSVLEYVWRVNGHTFYIYYYDRRLRQELVLGQNAPSADQNTAIVTRQRAERLFLMTPFDRRRYSINRPVIGAQLEDAVFFNLHAEPNNIRNEASAVVNIIQNYMANNYPTLTWAVTGDFNRPNNTINFPTSPANTFTHLLSSGQITHPSPGTGRSEELDYGFWGGPIAREVSMASIILLTDYIRYQIGRNIPNPSDHLPVKFN